MRNTSFVKHDGLPRASPLLRSRIVRLPRLWCCPGMRAGMSSSVGHRSRRTEHHPRLTATSMALPSWVPPQLSKLVKEPPGGPARLHEVKFDGYRMHARIDPDVCLLTRTGLDWTHKYKRIAEALKSLRVAQADLDGDPGLPRDGRRAFP